jgi:hypothetical protein
MGIWVGIKRALNSTLGTSTFKPLDKIILDNTRIVASDDVFFVYDGAWSEGGATSDTASNGWYRRTNSYIKFDRAGSVKFKWLQSNKASSSSGAGSYSEAKIRVIDETGAVVGSYSASLPLITTNYSQYEITVPINVETGKKYKVDVQRSSSYMDFNLSLVVGATLVFGDSKCTLTT